MSIYNGNQCVVFLEGHLSTMPIMMPNYSTHFTITVTRKFYSSHANKVTENQAYRVIIMQQDAIRILQYGHIGISLLIRGDLRIHDTAEIIADHIDFIDFSNSNSFSNTNYPEKITVKTRKEKSDHTKIIAH